MRLLGAVPCPHVVHLVVIFSELSCISFRLHLCAHLCAYWLPLTHLVAHLIRKVHIAFITEVTRVFCVRLLIHFVLNLSVIMKKACSNFLSEYMIVADWADCLNAVL